MPTLDFGIEKESFKEHYAHMRLMHLDALDSMRSLLSSAAANLSDLNIAKIDCRLKDRDECINKFIRKYRDGLEAQNRPYQIRDLITDLLGVRITCYYEDEIPRIVDFLENNFEIIEITDKTKSLEEKDDSFGYKELHADLKFKPERLKLPEYSRYTALRFEVQVRTLAQDAWSTLDHKIKYKKSIPNSLRRRINTLAALFELADREFLAIRDQTSQHTIEAEDSYKDIEAETEQTEEIFELGRAPRFTTAALDAFSFLRIANHFFPDFYFEDRKVDGFVQEILTHRPITTRGKFNFYLKNSIAMVKEYSKWKYENENRNMNAFTLMRHCLFFSDPHCFCDMLAEFPRKAFLEWLSENGYNLDFP